VSKPPHLPPEEEYLLACGRAMVHGVAAMTPAPPADLDWDRLIHLSRRTRLLAQLHHGLRSHAALVPPSAGKVLHEKAAKIAANSRAVTAELLRLVEIFQREDCPMIPYKGPVLAILAYQDVTLRHFSDLDLLIPRASMPRAAQLLETLGYRLEHRSARAAEAVHLGTEYHYLYRHPESGLAVELHGEAIPCYFSFPLTNEDLGKRLEIVMVDGRPVPSLSREDLVLLLAMHGTKHEWQCAEQVLSLAALVSRSAALRWEQLLDRATALGSRRVLLLGLNLSRSMFDCPLPERIVAEIDGDRMVAVLTAQVWDYFLGIRKPATSAMQTALFQARSRERRMDRVRYWMLKVFAPNWEEVEWLPLPRALMPLYWLLRPVRMVVQYGPELLGLAPPRAASRHHHHH
jgi:hypothetical protein